MKKLLLALMVLVCAATIASATDGVAIMWTTGWGAYTHDSPDVTGYDDYLLDSYSMTWQLIYSVDAVADDPDLSNSANGWVSNDDEVWATRTLAQSVGGANVVGCKTKFFMKSREAINQAAFAAGLSRTERCSSRIFQKSLS